MGRVPMSSFGPPPGGRPPGPPPFRPDIDAATKRRLKERDGYLALLDVLRFVLHARLTAPADK